MGYYQQEIKVTATTSAHNDERDKRELMLWHELCERIRELCSDEKYEPIGPMTF